jgi:hypothetical protein
MTYQFKELLSPFRLLENPTMYQGLPNRSKDDSSQKSSPPTKAPSKKPGVKKKPSK